MLNRRFYFVQFKVVRKSLVVNFFDFLEKVNWENNFFPTDKKLKISTKKDLSNISIIWYPYCPYLLFYFLQNQIEEARGSTATILDLSFIV